MKRKDQKTKINPEIHEAEVRLRGVKDELAQALQARAALDDTSSETERDDAARLVAQLQSQHHEISQELLAIKRAESQRKESEHREKKQRLKRIKAARSGEMHESPHEDSAGPSRWTVLRPDKDRSAEIDWEAAEAHEQYLERQRLEAEDKASAEELARLRRRQDKQRRKDQQQQRRDAKQRARLEAEAKEMAERQQLERATQVAARKQAALERAEKQKREKAQRRAEIATMKREQRAARAARGWLGRIYDDLMAFLRRETD